MLHNKRGAALLQVLLVSAVLAGMATMLLRASLSRSSNSRRTRRTVAANLLINRCQMEVDAIWGAKTPQAFARDLKNCYMTCAIANSSGCNSGSRVHTCIYPVDLNGDSLTDVTYTIEAKFDATPTNGMCKVTYTVTDNSGGSEVRL